MDLIEISIARHPSRSDDDASARGVFLNVKALAPASKDPAAGSEPKDWIWEELLTELLAAWDRRRTHSFELPLAVWKARCRLRRGQWSKLFRSEGMPFAKRQGEMLVRVGKWLST